MKPKTIWCHEYKTMPSPSISIWEPAALPSPVWSYALHSSYLNKYTGEVPSSHQTSRLPEIELNTEELFTVQKIVFFTFPIIWGVNSNCINFNQFSIFLPKYLLVIYFCEIIIVLVLVFHVAFSLFETRTKQDIFSCDLRDGRLTAEWAEVRHFTM